MEIVRILQTHEMVGTFFLNVYEYPLWGEVAMRAIAQKLQAAGHEVALHTHPETAYDPARTELFQYSLEEQANIIHDGMRLLAAWTGRSVTAHRAGDYSADARTIEALSRNGVQVDSSLFWGFPQCRLNGLGLSRNVPSRLTSGLIELPVTVYQRQELPRYLGEVFAPVTSVRKIDPNWFVDVEEARAAIDAVLKTDPPFVMVFLHSFSLMEKNNDNKAPVPNRKSLMILKAILTQLSEQHLQAVTMRESATSNTTNPPYRDIVPLVKVRVAWHRYFVHRLRASGTQFQVLAISLLVLIIVAALVITALRRGVRPRISSKATRL